MRIAEILPDLRPTTANNSVLSNLESSIRSLESISASAEHPPENLTADLRRHLSSLSSLLPLSDSAKIQIWNLSYRLWNACVDLSNSRSRLGNPPDPPDLRRISADLLLLAGPPAGIPNTELKAASFLHTTGLIWLQLENFDLAAGCFEKATDVLSSIKSSDVQNHDEGKLILDINLARSKTAWAVSDRNLAITLLNRSKNLLFGSPVAYKTLAEQFFHFGKVELSKNSQEAGNLLSEALDLCEKGILVSKTLTLDLELLKEKCLRFLAAERLQAEDYEGVLKCIAMLRKKGREGEHPSIGFIAMKAWLGLGKVSEAERELKGMMGNKKVPENVTVSAAERFLSVAGVEKAKGVLVGLVGSCRVGGPGAAVRVVRRVAEGGTGVGRAKAMAELAADEEVVALFEGGKSGKEKKSMHALLWNCGAEHFRLKEYAISAELFEKSMLYVTRNEENRSRRSNCFRVLCLCHLALAQLDRAEEFIDQAEKIEPNIKCSFLKFKICLQKKDEKQAINQIEAMIRCIDFNPEYLTLSTHEAIACQLLPVAITSLSTLLNLYSPGKLMPMPEVALLRNLITLLHRNLEKEHEILKYTRHAQAKMTELGVESFFGEGAVGIRELNWFAGNAWNMGLKMGKEKKYESCAEYLELASVFYSNISEKTAETNAKICKSLIISVGAMINAEEHNKVPMPGSDVKKAMDMLGKAGKLLPSVSSTDTQVEASTICFLHTFNAYRLLGRSDDTQKAQLQLIKSYASSKACTPQNLLQLALEASEGSRANREAAEFSLNACLSAHLSSPSSDYQAVATVLRKLVGLAGLMGKDDDGVFCAYRKAYQIIVGLKEGEYPTEEGKWLAMTAWNKAGMSVRIRQVEVARRWMKMGLDLARHVRGMEQYIGGMEESFSNFEKICNDNGGATSGGVDDRGGSEGIGL